MTPSGRDGYPVKKVKITKRDTTEAKRTARKTGSYGLARIQGGHENPICDFDLSDTGGPMNTNAIRAPGSILGLLLLWAIMVGCADGNKP